MFWPKTFGSVYYGSNTIIDRAVFGNSKAPHKNKIEQWYKHESEYIVFSYLKEQFLFAKHHQYFEPVTNLPNKLKVL